MLREEHVLNEIHAYRYRGDDPQYALIISHGIASHGGIYDVFCTHHAGKGADIWSFDEDYGYAGAGEQKRLDPWNTWSYDLSSWASLFTYEPKIPVTENKKPILFTCGEKDPSFPPELIKQVSDSIAGPVEFFCLDGGRHQLMLFHTEIFSAKVDQWVRAQI